MQIAQMFDERFYRVWEFHRSAGEIGFRCGKQMVMQMQMQMQLAKNPAVVPVTRRSGPRRLLRC